MSGRTETACAHCGTPYLRKRPEERFCCAGCEFVHALISREGFERFYALKGRQVSAPVKSVVFHSRDYDWLADRAKKAESAASTGEAPHLELDVQGISCAACIWLIESVFVRQEGALRIDVNAQLGQLRMLWEAGAFDHGAFARELQNFGYVLGPLGEKPRRSATRELATKMGICGAFALNGMAFSLPSYLGMGSDFAFAGVFKLVTVLSATLALLVGGGYFFRRAWYGLRHRTLHIDTPISLGIISAYLGSLAGWVLNLESLLYFDFVAVFIFLMLLGRWVQQLAVERNRNRLLETGIRSRQQMELINRGDRVEIKSGEMAAVRGRLLDIRAEFSLETINGEPDSRVCELGNEVPAGAVLVGRKPTAIEALESFEGSVLSRLLSDSSSRGYRNVCLERVLQVYLAAVSIIAVVGGLFWLREGGAAALQVFISVLVVSCPCALGVSLPLIDEMASGFMRRFGLFVRAANLWPRLGKVQRVHFDKTGTLTMETPELVNPKEIEKADRRILAAMVRDSVHPLSRALREHLFELPEDGEVTEIPGRGVVMGEWSLGKPGWRSAAVAEGTETHLCRGGELVARFRFREAIRDDAKKELSDLRRLGLEIGILSGDDSAKVRSIATALGLEDGNCLGDLSPDEKARHVGANALYVGDGANDSLAFDAALCRGTPAIGGGVLESKSDFYYLGRGLKALRMLFLAASQRRRAILSVMVFAVVYNIVAVGLCLAGWMNPLLAAVLMPISSIATLALAGALRPRLEVRPQDQPKLRQGMRGTQRQLSLL